MLIGLMSDSDLLGECLPNADTFTLYHEIV